MNGDINVQVIKRKPVFWTPWPEWAAARAIEKGGHMFYYETEPILREVGDSLMWQQDLMTSKKLCVGILDMSKHDLDGIAWTRSLQLRQEFK